MRPRDIKEDLREILRRPVASSEDARRAEEAARRLRDILEAEQRAEAAFARESAASYGRASSLMGLTLHDAARRVLEKAGRPLHAREIGVRMKAAGWKHPRSRKAKPEQIVHSLAAQLPKHGEFKRVKPQTFALSEWQEIHDTAPPPLVGIFQGPRAPTGRRISDGDAAAGASRWRSS